MKGGDKMKWLRIILPIFLSVGMILCIGSVAYAADPPDPGLDVDIVVVGDNPDVGVDIYGDNAEVWINGQNLNNPTAVYNVIGGGGFDNGWVNQRISDSLAPLESWAEGQAAELNLTMDGLAKLILLVQEHSSEIGTLAESLDSQGHVASIKESASDQRIRTLESQQAQITAEINHLTDSDNRTNRTLAIIIGAFSLVVISLATGLVLLWRRH